MPYPFTQGGCPAAVFYPIKHPMPYASTDIDKVNRQLNENLFVAGNVKATSEEKPGVESKRKTREEFTKMDKVDCAIRQMINV
jgi:hypothetical protein